jgi:hypothetical protein
MFTKRWQDNQREQDIKSTLVTKMSEMMVEPIANSRIWSRGAEIGPEMPSYSETLRKIDIRQAEISTLLKVYFRDQSDLLRDWASFAKALNYCVRLTAADTPERKDPHLRVVRDYVQRSDVDWNALSTAKWRDGFGPDFEQAYETLTNMMVQRGDEIIAKALASKFRSNAR